MENEEIERLTRAFTMLNVADGLLLKAEIELAKFGENVPSMNTEATKLWLEAIKSIDTSMGFIKSFIRVGVLRQVVKGDRSE